MEPNIFSFDPYLIGFVKGNLLTISLFIAFLKGIATMTPSTEDDKIVTLLANLFTSAKGESINGKTK